MSILKNAIDSIALGIEDYNSTDYRRLLSCTRNIFAGILLLFKHKLAELSPPASDEVLIKQKVAPNLDSSGILQWHGSGKKTVDVQEIEERFKGLNLTVDWSRVKKINDYRNNIEHYYSALSQDAVRALIADSFIVIRDFIRNHMGEDPLELLGVATWDASRKLQRYMTKKRRNVNRIFKPSIGSILAFRMHCWNSIAQNVGQD